MISLDPSIIVNVISSLIYHTLHFYFLLSHLWHFYVTCSGCLIIEELCSSMEGLVMGLMLGWWTMQNCSDLDYGTVGFDFICSGGHGGTLISLGKM